MQALLNSGNLAGLLGLFLMVYVGIRLVRAGHLGGWLLSVGSGLFIFSQLFRFYGEPYFHKPLHLTFNHFLITLVTSLSTITLSLGFLLIPLGLVLVAMRHHKESLPVKASRRGREALHLEDSLSK